MVQDLYVFLNSSNSPLAVKKLKRVLDGAVMLDDIRHQGCVQRGSFFGL